MGSPGVAESLHRESRRKVAPALDGEGTASLGGVERTGIHLVIVALPWESRRKVAPVLDGEGTASLVGKRGNGALLRYVLQGEEWRLAHGLPNFES